MRWPKLLERKLPRLWSHIIQSGGGDGQESKSLPLPASQIIGVRSRISWLWNCVPMVAVNFLILIVITNRLQPVRDLLLLPLRNVLAELIVLRCSASCPRPVR